MLKLRVFTGCVPISDGVEIISAGTADAIGFDPAGRPSVVVDWKSDVDPDTETIARYRAQVRSYLKTTGASVGMIVFVTPGIMIYV